MTFQMTPYMLPFLMATAIALTVSILAWRRETASGARVFSLLMVLVAWSCVNSVFFLGSTTLRSFFFWIRMSFLCGALGVLWLSFVRLYVGYDRSRTVHLAVLLSLEPALIFVLAWTNDVHHLLWSGEHIISGTAGGAMLHVGFTFGPLFWVWTVYEFMLLGAGAIVLVQGLAHSADAYRGQLMTVLGAMVIPWLANILFLIERAPVDLTPLAYAVSSTILFFALFRFHFLDLVPVLHSFVLEAIPNGILVLDARDRIVDMNPAAGILLGRSARETLGKPGMLFLPELTSLGEWPAQEYTRIVKGSERVYSVSAVPLRRRSGRLIVFDDITERKRIGLQLMQVQKMNALGLMAGGIAHDFNNLLTGILGNLSMLQQEGQLTPDAAELVSQAEQAAGSAARLTHSLLAFSCTDDVSSSVVDLNAVLETSMHAISRMMPKGIVIRCSCDPALWHIAIDPAQLTQIFMNLAVNARDALHDRGTINVRTANVTLDKSSTSLHPGAGAGAYVLLSVSDTGEGMTEEVQQHLFEPFFTTKPVGHGTGLGLSVVYGAVQRAGGWISVDSAPGVGSTFTLYFPRCADPLKLSQTMPPSVLPTGHETILVVDDEQSIQQLVARMLRSCGYMTLTAADGPAALALLRDHTVRIDAVLLDMMMPGMSGRQVLQQIRSDGMTVPVLVSSGYVPAHDVQGSDDNGAGGANAFLTKPYDLQELATAVRGVLDAAN